MLDERRGSGAYDGSSVRRGDQKRPEELRCRPGFVLPRISVRLGLSPVAYFKLPGSSTGLRLATRDSSTLAPAGNDVNRFSAIFSLMFAHNDLSGIDA